MSQYVGKAYRVRYFNRSLGGRSDAVKAVEECDKDRLATGVTRISEYGECLMICEPIADQEQPPEEAGD